MVYFCGMGRYSKSEQTRISIIERSAPIFNKKGYTGTSMKDIMEATGLTKGGIYGHFKSKEEIALAAFELNVQKVTSRIAESTQRVESARDKLRYILIFYRSYLFDPPVAGGCPILNAAVEADDMHPWLRDKVAERLDALIQEVARIVGYGIKRKEFPGSVKPLDFAVIYVSSIEGGIMMSRISSRPDYLSMALNNLDRMVDTL